LDFSQPNTIFLHQLQACDFPQIDILIHLVAVVPSHARDIEDFYRINFINSRTLLQNIDFREHAGILNFSSASVYNTCSVHLKESSPLTTTDDYGISKYLFENFVYEHARTLHIRSLSVRVPVLLVPFVQNNFIAKWRDQLLKGSEVTLFNPKSLFNSCVWVEDIFSFFQKIITNRTIHNLTCNVGAKDGISIEDAFYTLSEAYKIHAVYREMKNNRVAQDFDISLAISYGYNPLSVVNGLQKIAFEEQKTC